MNDKYELFYLTCVELSNSGDKVSLSKLISLYMAEPSKRRRRTIKHILKKPNNKEMIVVIIDENLEYVKTEDEKLQLLKLGMSIWRYHYIFRYLQFLNKHNIDLKSVDFFRNIYSNPLSQKEKNEIESVSTAIPQALDCGSRLTND